MAVSSQPPVFPTRLDSGRPQREQYLRILKGHTFPVRQMCWSPNGHRLATASGDGTARIWDAVSGKQLRVLSGHKEPVNSVAWSPDGATLATAGDDGTVRVWNVVSGDQLRQLARQANTVDWVSWSPDGRTLATASADKTARLWEAASGKQLLSMARDEKFPISQAFWSPDGATLATANKSAVQLWNIKSGHKLRMMGWPMAWSPDGRKLASGRMHGFMYAGFEVQLGDAKTGKLLHRLAGPTEHVTWASWSPDGHSLTTSNSAWSPDGRIFRSGGGDTPGAWSWDLISGRQVPLNAQQALAMNTLYSPSLRNVSNFACLSPDGRIKATFIPDGIQLEDAATGGKLHQIVHSGPEVLRRVTSVAWSPDRYSTAFEFRNPKNSLKSWLRCIVLTVVFDPSLFEGRETFHYGAGLPVSKIVLRRRHFDFLYHFRDTHTGKFGAAAAQPSGSGRFTHHDFRNRDGDKACLG